MRERRQSRQWLGLRDSGCESYRRGGRHCRRGLYWPPGGFFGFQSIQKGSREDLERTAYRAGWRDAYRFLPRSRRSPRFDNE